MQSGDAGTTERAGRRRVAILGGGVGAITAAFALTDSLAARERFEVTIYQMGWRIGGKGASGRDAARGQRIEEHGLHVWLGWYENAFTLLRRCYEELGRPAGAPLRSLDEAFVAHSEVGVSHGASSHGRTFWMLDFPRGDARVGMGEGPTGLREQVGVLVGLVRQHLRSSLLAPTGPGEAARVGLRERLRPGVAIGAARRLARGAIARALARLDAAAAAGDLGGYAGLLGQVGEALRRRLGGALAGRGREDEELDGLGMLVDFTAAMLRGLVVDRALLFGLDVLDAWDLKEWLARHGARPSTIEAPFIKAWYDLAFAYEEGDTSRPNFAAGAALRAILRTCLTYRGAIFWKMQGGMGDVVFAPYYEVLRRRGVRFEFFHRVDAVETAALPAAALPAAARRRVERVRMTVQATVRSGSYSPLVDVGGLPCWPNAPLVDQLVEGEAIAAGGVDLECPWSGWEGVGERVLERGRDFDEVVLGISLGALRHICGDLVAGDAAWRRMVEAVGTVATQAVQLWMEPSLEELGWRRPSPILDAYDDPFNTWADMSFLLPREAWAGASRPRSLAYLVGPLHEHAPAPEPGSPDGHGFQDMHVEGVRARVGRWLDRAGPGIWPSAARRSGAPGFDRGVLHAEGEVPAEARLHEQYSRANVAGSERYVQSLKGSTRHRLFADGSGVEGLTLAGDWLNTGINSGDVEAATITGLQVARALLGAGRRIEGEGDGWGRFEVARAVEG